MSVTQYQPSVLQKHWSRIDAFSLQQLEKQIRLKITRTFLKGHSYEETITVGKVGKF